MKNGGIGFLYNLFSSRYNFRRVEDIFIKI